VGQFFVPHPAADILALGDLVRPANYLVILRWPADSSVSVGRPTVQEVLGEVA
jgi:hypothetical protein